MKRTITHWHRLPENFWLSRKVVVYFVQTSLGEYEWGKRKIFRYKYSTEKEFGTLIYHLRLIEKY